MTGLTKWWLKPASADRAYRYIYLKPGEPPGPLAYPGKFEALAASPGGLVFALASVNKSEGKLQFICDDNKDHGRADTLLGRQNRPVHAIAWPAENLLVTGGEKGEVIIWDAKNGTQKQTPKLNSLPLETIRFVDVTFDGQYVLATDGRRLVVNRGNDLKFNSEHPQRGISAAVFSPVEPLVAWAAGKTIYFQHVDWVQLKAISREDSPQSGEILCLAFSRDGKRIAFGTTSSKVHILDVSKITAR